MEARAASAESAGRSVTPQTVPSARGEQTRGQRVRGRGLRPTRAEPAQRWLGAGRRPSGRRRPRPPDPKSSRAPGRAARRPRAVSRDAGRWGSRVRSCVCPGPLQPRQRPRFPLSLRALPTAGDSCDRGSGHCLLLPTAAVPRTLPPSPFGDKRACPRQGRAEGQKFFPRDACPTAAPRSDGGRVRFFELASPVPGPPTSRPAVRTGVGTRGLFS